MLSARTVLQRTSTAWHCGPAVATPTAQLHRAAASTLSSGHRRPHHHGTTMPPTTAADGSGVSAAAVTSSQQQAGNGGGSRSSSLTQAVSPEARRAIITASIRGIPDFPKPGILFWDVTTLLLNPAAFQHTIDAFYERYKDQRVDVVAGFEARGLIFGAPLALALGVPFVPLRKPGKLPGQTVSEAYITEYSTDTIEMHTGAVSPGQRVLLVDDLIATGGTLKAGINLMRKVGADVVEAACVIELPALKGREKLEGLPLFVLIEMEGE